MVTQRDGCTETITGLASASMSSDFHRTWLSDAAAAREQQISDATRRLSTGHKRDLIEALTERSRTIHERECFNLNPASNVMNPRAEALLAAGLGTRASLGHAGDKYEVGLEAIEELEVMTADLACDLFGARHAEIRVASGAMANLYAFLACAQPGDAAIVPPPSIGGHVTHNTAGAAGLRGLQIHEAPIDGANYTVDVDGVAELARRVRPKIITIGASLNLTHHPVAELRQIADEVGAYLLFDAAHLCGVIAGGAWPNPLEQGAHIMTMSTYKSLAGPPGGLLLINDDDLARRIDAIAYPGLTANFDVGRTTALAMSLADLVDFGSDYAAAMVDTASALAASIGERGIDLFTTGQGPTRSHQFALRAEPWGGGHATAVRLRDANLLTCAIGLPDGEGLRLGTPELVRWGMTVGDMERLGDLLVRALRDEPSSVASEVSALRRRYTRVHFCS